MTPVWAACCKQRRYGDRSPASYTSIRSTTLAIIDESALAKYFPGKPPDYVSLEGYLAGSVLVEALKRNGPQLDTEKLVDTLENVRDFDMGLGTPVSFGRTEHQALHKVWGTELDATGHYQAIDLQ
jgi:branched-chain amino acid transport system substrate-binding protein